jgi:hypothetical protein
VSQSESTSARSPEQIEAEIVSTRDSLADSVDELSMRMRPSYVIGEAKDRTLAFFHRADGSLDPRKVGGAAAVGAVLVLYLIRRRGAS